MASSSKRAPRVMGEIDPQGVAWVRGAEAHHLVHVLRARRGDPVLLLDGRGSAWEGSLEQIGSDRVQVRLQRPRQAAAGPERVLLCGLIRSARWDWLVEKATELGATRIVPLITERSHRLARGSEPVKRARWERLARTACKQSGRIEPPRIEAPFPLYRLGELELPSARLLFSPGADRSFAQLALDRRAGLAAAIGPEGGFAPKEEQLLQGRGFGPVGLGTVVLRTETAALAALAILQAAEERCG